MQTLTTLYLDNNRIGDQGVQSIGEALDQNIVRPKHSLRCSDFQFHFVTQTLTTLYLFQNEIGSKGVEYLEKLKKTKGNLRIS